ncbi:predicted protein [Lichtheimia corymbifera JMRC:FSU:9682]|uniref:Uncharacterized protein n=1 Tax=Lichtheimia corymbifera JMRC:FSU:9682 TaxID=1263082 RepID=A0A068RXZ6_9FUNG|nr:predicted protein [Lichtheimia corymbifera JMRC:FSU:9682]
MKEILKGKEQAYHEKSVLVCTDVNTSTTGATTSCCKSPFTLNTGGHAPPTTHRHRPINSTQASRALAAFQEAFPATG